MKEFLPALPLYISGSSYVARYTGAEFSPLAIQGITIVLAGFVVLGLFHKNRIAIAAFLLGIVIHSYMLLYMVDRFNLRYFALLSIILWLLAGVGFGVVLKRLLPPRILQIAPIFLACVLMAWTAHTTLIPFLKTGGSLNQFSLGNRNDKSSAFIDIRPLVSCIQGKGAAYSPSQDIYDRLLFLSRENTGIAVVDGDNKSEARITVSYKKPEAAFVPDESSLCPDIPFFTVVARQ